MKKVIVLATNNAHKLMEVREILPNDIEILSLKEAGIDAPDVEENGSTYKENSLIKASNVASLTNLPVLADDSGLEISFLGEHTPGIYTKRYAESHGGQENTNLMLSNMAKNISKENNKAIFTCHLTLLNYKGKEYHFEGHMKGSISTYIGGSNGFGYDPIFICEGYDKTVAELSQVEKNMISHRYHALKMLVDFLNKN